MLLSYRRLTLAVSPRCLRRLQRRLRYVRAAGGLVVNSQGALLLMVRNGHWDLPKGKVESGETLGQAALREVQEETGIGASLGPLVAKTYHLYHLYGGWHLKQTAWYAMQGEGDPTPQAEEGIAMCRWVPMDEARRLLRSSYGTMRILARKTKRLWPRSTR